MDGSWFAERLRECRIVSTPNWGIGDAKGSTHLAYRQPRFPINNLDRSAQMSNVGVEQRLRGSRRWTRASSRAEQRLNCCGFQERISVRIGFPGGGRGARKGGHDPRQCFGRAKSIGLPIAES